MPTDNEISVAVIVAKIWEIRGKKVMLDSDLAKLYEVPTKVLIQAVSVIAGASLQILPFSLPKKKKLS